VYTRVRVWRRLEDKVRRFERFGHASVSRPPGKLVWIHAVSVGEALSVIPFISKLRGVESDVNILLTTTTLTSAKVVEERLGDSVIHQFAPFDVPLWVRRFIDCWNPSIAFFVESELWPNTLCYLKECKIPTYLLNARCSKRSLEQFYMAKRLLRLTPFCTFQEVYVSSPPMLTHVKNLGANNAFIMPSLKMISEKLPVSREGATTVRQAVGMRKVWIAVSTHAGEELTILKIHKQLKETMDIITVIVVRHPSRVNEVVKLCYNNGLTCVLHSSVSRYQRRVGEEIYIVDRVGCLGAFFESIGTVLVCGSLIPGVGGHNFLEPLQFGCDVATGKYFANFADVYPYVEHACSVVTSPREIYEFVARSISKRSARRSEISRTHSVISSSTPCTQIDNFSNEWENVIRSIMSQIKIRN
jgi:3-deoxy-D-manno-octulosonic-acid transferase